MSRMENGESEPVGGLPMTIITFNSLALRFVVGESILASYNF